MNNITIRPYQQEDRAAVRAIAWDTAYFGEPADAFFTDREILADILTAYFTDYEPESCFVAETENKVVGYLTGTKNAQNVLRGFALKIFPRLLLKSIWTRTLFNPKNLRFIYHFLRSILIGEYKTPNFFAQYPAELHINIKKEYRSLGIGAQLMDTFITYLKQENISGVQLSTMSEKASRFFQQQGFVILHQTKRTYFRYLLQKDIPIYLCGKKLQ